MTYLLQAKGRYVIFMIWKRNGYFKKTQNKDIQSQILESRNKLECILDIGGKEKAMEHEMIYIINSIKNETDDETQCDSAHI